LDAFARRATSVEALAGATPDPDALGQFRAAMDDDLQTPTATGLLFDLVRRANVALDAGDAAAAAPLAAGVFEIAGALGLALRTEAATAPDEVLAWAAERDAARAAKDWARADALRDQITAAGYVVEDTPSGAVVRPA
ncbi:MAG TPA: DALR domain-containing protein, partial [Acidimicrobiales bacterium]|nr:DALR domain-containing protein [Acidimicrobiales bacterium]